MQSNKKIVKKSTGIKLTKTRANTIVTVEVNFGALGEGLLMVRPLLYTDHFRTTIDAKLREVVESGEEGVEALDAIQSYLLPLVADWQIYSPLDQVMECQEITDADAILAYKMKMEDMEESDTQFAGTVVDDDDPDNIQILYKLPVNAKSMRLFPVLGNSSGIDAILKALSQISF